MTSTQRLISPQAVLQHVFGFETFRPLQEKIIQRVCQGEDNFVLMPTGGGKSLCYQIPALIRPGTAIVVSPLIALMHDQVAALQMNGVRAAFYNSSLSREQADVVWRQLQRQELDLLYVAPERLNSEWFIARLQQLEIALFAIDEAHCISMWGHDFRPDYAGLGKLRHWFPNTPVIALTATADQQTRDDIIQQLQLTQANAWVASFNRPNLRYTIVDKLKPKQQLLHTCERFTKQAGIIYCTTRSRVEEIAEFLLRHGYQAAPYHAGLSYEQREQHQTAFIRDEIDIMVATVAFGMGVDKPNIRYVIHYDCPKNIESYYQETGRAGRDGLPAEVITFYSLGDVTQIRAMLSKTENDTQRRVEKHKLDAMVAFAETQSCRRQVLLNYFSEDLPTACGNCDICLNPPETYDATVDAQKALSCVYRVRQRYGVGHVIDILRGAKTQKILQAGHDRLSTYGIGKAYSQPVWMNLFRQLIHRGYLQQDMANYAVLTLTEKSWALLKQETNCHLARPQRLTAPANKRLTKSVREDVDEDLFSELRALRKELADQAGVPPFIIFSDASLIEMAAQKPQTERDFLTINGVGEYKLRTYGQPFLAVLSDNRLQQE